MRANISSLTVGTINAGTISTINLSASNLSAGTLSATTLVALDATISSISTTSITLDGNTLDTGGGGFGATLLLNGVAIATTSNISSLTDWAYFPAISTIDCDQKDIVDCKNIFATNLTATNSIAGVIGGFTTLNSGSIVNSGSILTNTLQTTGLINAASISTPSLKANLISTATGLFSTINANTISTASLTAGVLGVSSLNATTASFSTILVSSIVLPPAEEVSSITIDNLTVNTSANFSGARPNFTTGINTSGPNNFNNTNLDNCGQINAGALNLFGSATIGLTADSGGSILTNTAINLATSNGGSSVINIAAKRNALLAYPVPLSQVNITAEGNCPNIPVVPLTPYGGAVNIVACNGPSPIFPLVAVTDAFAPGAIHLTAYSKGLFPGLITESAGSILAYSGLTNPTAGLYGCSFYSALTCLSLTAGLSPALTSFPGTVYLRGDNGTKVLNGLYIDHLYPAAGYTLAISGAGGCNVTIDDCSYIGMTTNPVLDGGNVNGRIRNFSTISALKLLAPTLSVSTISTATVSVDQIYTRNINIDPTSTIYTVHPDLTINANLTTDENDDPQPNNLNLFASSNINIQSIGTGGGGGNVNIQCTNNPALYSINLTGDAYVSRTLNVGMGISTTNLLVSSINNAAYPPGGGGGWVSTATTALNMAGFNINNVSTIIPPSGIDLTLQNNSGGASIDLENAGSIYMVANSGATNQGMNSGLIFNNGVNITNKVFGASSAHTFEVYDGSSVLQNSVIINNTTLTTSSLTVSSINGAAYPPSGGGSTISTFTTLTTSSFTVSSINGATFTNTLSMGINPIILKDNNHGLVYGDGTYRDVNIDGPFLFGYSAGALGVVDGGDSVKLSWGRTEVNLFEPLDMNGNVITDNTSTLTISSINVNMGGPGTVALASGDLSTNYTSLALFSTSVFIAQVGDTSGVIDINAAGNIQTAAFSTINTVQNTYFSGSVSRRLDGVGVLQPVIQYGQVSSSGSAGTVIVSTPQAYSAVNTYLPFACMADAPAAEIYVSTLTEQAFEIGWQNGGGGNQLFNWQTLGT